MIYVNGMLFGTTEYYGDAPREDGMVFSMSVTGKETILYSFKGRPDGNGPLAGLLDVNGTLYGTTREGGNATCPLDLGGCGTVFKLRP